jgi:hypothetical protein
MSLAAFNVTVPSDGMVVLPPEFAGQAVRIVIEKPVAAEEEQILTQKEKRKLAWQTIDQLADRIASRNKRLGLKALTEEEVMALVKECRREEGEAMRRAEQGAALCTE